MDPEEALLMHSKFRKAKRQQQQRQLQHDDTSTALKPRDVFRFDSIDRERYSTPYTAINEEEEEDVFSSSKAASSSAAVDSPRITISPLRIQDSPSPTPLTPVMDQQQRLGHAMLQKQQQSLFGVPSSPVSPLTPNTPLSPLLFHHAHNPQGLFLAELYRRRCHSDSDLPLLPDSPKHRVGGSGGTLLPGEDDDEGMMMEAADLTVVPTHAVPVGPPALHPRSKKPIPHPLTLIAAPGGSLESEHSSASPQDSPLDLSLRGSSTSTSNNSSRNGSTSSDSLTSMRCVPSLAHQQILKSTNSVPKKRTGGNSEESCKASVALRYNLDVSPVVEEMPAGSELAFVCPTCGQMFSLHDRLAKHMASRHKVKPHDPNKNYPCEICHRSFARSDMLTRHVRLHTGIKPYTCKVCGQVFSRSDHLSTHQRTHTGEKPYKCPQCPYSACRRDMITRHLRTHTRNLGGSSDQGLTASSSSSSSDFLLDQVSRPPSSTSSSGFPPDSPLSPLVASAFSTSPSAAVLSPQSPS